MTRLIEMFVPLKSFFLSQEHPPTIIKQFFENELSEIYIWYLHSLLFSVFHTHIQAVERASNSVVEVLTSLVSVQKLPEERKNQNFLFLKVKELLSQKRSEGYEIEGKNFLSEVANLYENYLQYLNKWMKPLEELFQVDVLE